MSKNQSEAPCLIRSRDFSPTIIELEGWPDKDSVPSLASLGLKRNMMHRWIVHDESYATEKHGLCFSYTAVKQGIREYYNNVELEWTETKANTLIDILERKMFFPYDEAIYQIHDLGNENEVALAMRRISAKVKCELVKRKTPASKFKPLYNSLMKLKDVELLRDEIVDKTMPLTELLTGYVVGVDIEWLERKPAYILEVALSHIKAGVITTEHFIIEENEHLVNGNQVPDNKLFFMFGDSERLSLETASKRVSDAFEKADAVFGHAPHNDFKALSLPQAQINKLNVLDTRLLHKKIIAACQGGRNEKTKLSTIAPFYLGDAIKETPFHNAGNDIHVTGSILMLQANVDWIRSRYVESSKYAIAYKAETLAVINENIKRGESVFKAYIKASGLDSCASIENMIEYSPLKAMDAIQLAKKIHCIAPKVVPAQSIDFGLTQWQQKDEFKQLEETILARAKAVIASVLNDKAAMPNSLLQEWMEVGLESAWGKKELSRQHNDRLIDLLYQFKAEDFCSSM